MHKARGNQACAEIENPKLGIRASVIYDTEDLPCFTEWINLLEQDYVLGLEPGTHNPIGRAAAKKSGTLVSLLPGEKRTYSVSITFETF
jgi:galactose mutarotase-like enzyme